MDNWKDKVLISMKGSKRAKPPVDAFEKIQGKIQAEKMEDPKLRPFQWIAAAASIAVIVGGNLFFIISYQNQSPNISDSRSYSQVVSDFNIYTDEN
jgi:hypothetical protein